VSSKSEVRQCWTIVWQMMSVEMARTAVGRTTIDCWLRWCATRCAGLDTAEMTSAESWTSARPTYSWCAVWGAVRKKDVLHALCNSIVSPGASVGARGAWPPLNKIWPQGRGGEGMVALHFLAPALSIVCEIFCVYRWHLVTWRNMEWILSEC